MSDATAVAEPPVATESKPKGELVHRAQFGAVSAAVFGREIERADGTSFTDYSFTVDRSYMNKDGEWDHTYSFRQRDILAVIETLTECYKESYSQEEKPADPK